ncbi:transporter substrate-binding domain-containing protein [Sinanaerobacter chloroacetimidivorans]|uniref:Transporter substrate-binding domain-containing protein n=1 Tax=Sinanaerobacter chloroacetimidivorans TaxID=2818044 RepID=A0A8J7VYN9_9FIRM|nr:transporter substrate-binding domain-containing protein [Sinanaerobacter chloroacetimidivorans]MBR0597494.1 transporter substrate-binding domain-containing protein [Sinanaerobacter chloroacetimidivorans]
MKKEWKKPIIALLILVLTLGLAACGGAEESKNDSENGNAQGQDVINVGTMGTYNPFSFAAEDGTLTGYDLEVLREIEKVDNSLKFNFVAGPWDSLFVGLDANKFQMLANQITSNPDRVEKYYLTENPYFTCVSQIIVKKGRTDIQSLEDLQGKTIGLTVGDSFTRLVEDWNAENGNILTIKYYEQDIVTILEDIQTGRIDATVNDPIMAKDKAEVQGLEIDVVGERIAADPTYFIFQKNDEGKALRDKVDAALATLLESGRLSELSIEWFGVDYTK